MPLHFPSGHKKTHLAVSPSANGSSSVNKSTTFGLGPAQWKVTDEKHPANLSASLRALRTSGLLTDISFAYADENLKANRVVLAAVSPVMRNVFMKRENLMNAEVIPPEALRQLVHFVYDAHTEVKLDAIKRIGRAARVLEATAIKTMCDNVMQILPSSPAPRIRIRPKLQRMMGFEETSLTDDVIDGQVLSAAAKENLSQTCVIARSESCCSTSSDIGGGMEPSVRHDARPSIKLTFHSRSNTPLNRSVEDLRSSSESLTTVANDRSRHRGSLDAATTSINVRPSSRSSVDSDDKRGARSEERTIRENRSPAKPRSGSCNVNGHRPILLSVVLNDNATPPLEGTMNLKSGSPQDDGNLMKETVTGTWPRLKDAGLRAPLPEQWKSNSNGASKSPRAETKSADLKQGSQKKPKRIKSRDTFSVGFKSETIPGLLKGLNQLREQNIFCDLTLIVGAARINCHKVVLAASSRVFSAIVQKIHSKEIVLTKVDESAVQELVRFIYSGQCTIEKENVMGVLRAAWRFQFSFLVRQCVNYLERNCSNAASLLTAENVLLAYKISGGHGCSRLREESRKFASSRFWELTETQAFKELSSLDLNRLISCETIRLARTRDNDLELQFFMALLKWLTYKAETRLPGMTSRVMKFVQFSNMKSSTLNRVVSKETVVMADPETKQRILLALRNHTAPSGPASPVPQSSPEKIGGKQSIKALVMHKDNNDKTSSKLYSVNAADNHWEEACPCPVTWSGYAVASHGNTLYVAGGRDVKKKKHICADVFKYENQMWTHMPSMLIDRAHFAIVPLGGALYALGGMSESAEKGGQGYQITSSIERFTTDAQRENSKWKMASARLPCPSYFHAAAVCEATVRYSPLQDTLNGSKDKTSEGCKPASPSRNKLGQRHNSSSINCLGKTESDSPFNRQTPKQNALKYKKPSPGRNDGRTRTIRRPVIMICGGKSKPTQNLQLDPVENRTVEKRHLPYPATSPMMTSSGSRLYLASSGTDSSSHGASVHQYNLTDDQWTEIKVPGLSSQSLLTTGKLSRLRSSFRGRDDKPQTQNKLLLSCTTFGSTVVCVVVNGSDVTLQKYDFKTCNWTSLRSKKCMDIPVRTMALLTLHENC